MTFKLFVIQIGKIFNLIRLSSCLMHELFAYCQKCQAARFLQDWIKLLSGVSYRHQCIERALQSLIYANVIFLICPKWKGMNVQKGYIFHTFGQCCSIKWMITAAIRWNIWADSMAAMYQHYLSLWSKRCLYVSCKMKFGLVKTF